jgi:hypothetical protein
MFGLLPESLLIPLAFGTVASLLGFAYQSRRHSVSRRCYDPVEPVPSFSGAPPQLAERGSAIADTGPALHQNGMQVSEGFALRYGLPPEQTHISEEEWIALAHPEVLSQIESEMRNLRTPGGPLASQVSVPRRDGSVRRISMRAEIFPGRSDRLVLVRTMDEDITEIDKGRSQCWSAP